jgi:hypothetical protein
MSVKRQMRAAITLSSGSRICTSPISLELFRLFQEDMAAEGQDRPLDSAGSAQGSAVGVRGADALEVVRWTNTLINGSYQRLPTRDEIEDPRVSRLLHHPQGPAYSYWVQPEAEGRPPVLWAPDAERHPLVISDEVVRQHVTDDLRAEISAVSVLFVIRARSTAIALLQLLEIARHLGLDRVLARLPDLAQTLDGAVENGLVTSLDVGLDLGLTLGLNLEPARVHRAVSHLQADLDEATIHELIRVLALDLVQDLRLGFGLAADGALPPAVEVESLLNLVKGMDHDLARDLRRTSRSPLDVEAEGVASSARTHDPQIRQLMTARDRLRDLSVSRALSQAISATRSWPVPHRKTSREEAAAGVGGRFAGAFAGATGVMAGDWDIDPEALSGAASEAAADLEGLLEGSHPSDPWTTRVLPEFDRSATAFFARGSAPQAGSARWLRLTALCLAAEADLRHSPHAGWKLRLVAAGATWLERRHTGLAQPTETVVLASD